jgi:hypothetical protein
MGRVGTPFSFESKRPQPCAGFGVQRRKAFLPRGDAKPEDSLRSGGWKGSQSRETHFEGLARKRRLQRGHDRGGADLVHLADEPEGDVQIVRRHPSGIEVHAAARELRSKTLDSVSCRCSHRFFDLDGYKEAQDSFPLPASSLRS